MNSVPDIYRILPEVILTITGVLVMLVDASIAPFRSRRYLGWLAAAGTVVAYGASIWQLSLPMGTAFSETVESSTYTVFFHVLICAIVLVVLLLSLDTLPEDSHHQGEYYALMVFGAVGMCLMTSAVELLVVFIGLEISSIATYILVGYRKQTGRGPESAIKYFLLGSFATAFLLYGIAMVFGAPVVAFDPMMVLTPRGSVELPTTFHNWPLVIRICNPLNPAAITLGTTGARLDAN